MKYFVPAKTFLAGEYSVLIGGAALGLATKPCFEISYLRHDGSFSFHPESPAGLYLQKNPKKTEDGLSIQLHDPFIANGIKGGFGKSTAEYFAAIIPDLILKPKSPAQIHLDYLSLFEKQEIKPSGVDLMIQYTGGVSYIDQSEKIYRALPWKWTDFDFFIISTGLKIATHEHLAKLNLQDLKDLPAVSNQVIDAYLHKDSISFLSAMSAWVQALRKRGLTHPEVQSLKEELEKIPGVLLAKPCGALGADVVLVFYDTHQKTQVKTALKVKNIKIQADQDDLTDGLSHELG